jgi:hypothetical protein
MLKVPPPVWALVYVLLALAISWQLDWPKMPGFPLPLLGIVLDDRFHEICVVEQAELVERTACWRIPGLRSAKRGAVSWQDGGERSNWQ